MFKKHRYPLSLVLFSLLFFFLQSTCFASGSGEHHPAGGDISFWPLLWISFGCGAYGYFREGEKHFSLGTGFLGLVGATLVLLSQEHPVFSVAQETLLLVVFLAGLMGVAPIKLPRMKKMWAYPIMAGCLSALMDSFLVLLVISRMKLEGNEKQQRKFKIYCTLAALVGGLMIYFGEVFALPVFLAYKMKSPLDTLPIVPPAMMYLCILAFLTSRLQVSQDLKDFSSSSVQDVISEEKSTNTTWEQREDLIEFLLGISLLLSTHNPLLCLGALLLYASMTGQGEHFIEIMKTDLEVEVMLLLTFAVLIESRAGSWISGTEAWLHLETGAISTGYLGLVPSTVNAVIFGALKAKSGDPWFDVTIVSTGAQILPCSSLVGVMIFKSREDWIEYAKHSIPLAALWMGISLTWFWFIYSH